MMTRFFNKTTFILLCLLTLLVSSCQDPDGPNPPESTETATSTATSTEPATVTVTLAREETVEPEVTATETQPSISPFTLESTAARILERGKILAAYYPDAEPFSYTENGEPAGFDIEMVREFARRWLGDEGAVEFIPVTTVGRLTSIANGEVDLTASAITRKRQKDETIDFSQTYYADVQRLLVREESGISELPDLDGLRVGGVQGTSSLAQIAPLAEEAGITIKVIDYPNYVQAVSALKNEQIDAVTSDSSILGEYAKDNSELAVVGKALSEAPYAIGVPQGDSDFREFVNFTLQEMKLDGTYDEIYGQWFPNDEPYPIATLPGDAPYAKLSDFPKQITIPTESLSRIDKFLAREKILVGYYPDAPPFSFAIDGQPAGFDIEMVKEFALRWLHDANAVEFVPVTVEGRLRSVANGEVDFTASAVSYKRERAQTVDFSQVYHSDAQKLLVSEESGINELEELDGQKVGAVQDSTALAQIEALVEQAGVTIEVIDYPNHTQAVNALIKGQIEAVTSPSLILEHYAKANPKLKVVGRALSSEPLALALPTNDYRLRELINFTLQEMKRDGAYERIHQQWFPNESPYPIAILSGDADYLLVPYEGLMMVPDMSVITMIGERDRLIVGVRLDLSPFGFLDEEGQESGFDVELIEAMAAEWGIGKEKIEFVPVTLGTALAKLEAHEVDLVAAALVHRKEYEEKIDFSQTYFYDGQTLLVQKDSDIKGIGDLDGKRVAAVGDADAARVEAYAAVNKVSIQVVPFKEYKPALEALKASQVAALTGNNAALSGSAKDNQELEVVGELFSEAPYALGLLAGDSFFNHLVNFTLQDLKKKGVYDALYRKWFGREPDPSHDVEVLPGEWPYTFADSPTALDKPVRSKVDQLLTDCTFRAGVKNDFPPFGFIENQEVVGFDVDIVKEFAKRWCGDQNAAELVPVTSSNRIEKLAQGEVHLLAASMTHRRQRDERIDFSQTYFFDQQRLLVGKDSDINEVADLEGRRVGAIRGSTSIENIQIEANNLGITIKIVPFLEHTAALNALRAGQLDALTTDGGALLYFAEQNSELEVVGEPFANEPYGLGVPNYDDRFRDLVNFTLQEMKVDGTYDTLYQKWFGDDVPYDVEVWPGQSYLEEFHPVPMIRIAAGEFVRGNNESFSNNQKPEQPIFLDQFYIDQYEVTNRLYDECVKAGSCEPPRFARSLSFPDYYADSAYANYPVVWVTWEDAEKYCAFAGKRLPTEAEWEKAARGPRSDDPNAPKYLYPWGDSEPNSRRANFNNPDTVPVGSYPDGVSPYGVYDMAGNVREWVADWHRHDYYQNAPQQNPQGPDSGVTKVIRGGAFPDDASLLTTTGRKDFLPQDFDSNLGFRCASSAFPR